MKTLLKFLTICVYIVSSSTYAINKEEVMNYTVSHKYQAKSCDYRIKFLVLHYTVGDFERSLEELTRGPVSSHYLVPQTKTGYENVAFQLVDESLRAWTEGVSFWGKRTNINDTAIGIEIVNGSYKEEKGEKQFFPYTEEQIEIIIGLCKDIIDRYKIEPTKVLGHGDVAPGRKVDPGPLFPWERLYKAGIGAWPDSEDIEAFKKELPEAFDIQAVQKDLAKYGYDVNTDGDFSDKTQNVLSAFQMHFRPSNYDGIIDKETVAILKSLLKKYYNINYPLTNTHLKSRGLIPNSLAK